MTTEEKKRYHSLHEAQKLIREDRMEMALEILEEIIKQDPVCKEALYLLGTIALLQGEPSLAAQYLEKSIAGGFRCFGLYQNLGSAREASGEVRRAEEAYKKSRSLAEYAEEDWIAANSLADLYLKNGMLLKAEKIALELQEKYPLEYQGFHLQFLILRERKKQEEISQYFTENKERFAKEEQFYIDCLGWLREQGSIMDELRILEENPGFTEVIPKIAWKRRAELLLKFGRDEEAAAAVWRLFCQTGDGDAAFASMIFSVMYQDYLKAGTIANIILQSESERRGWLFYLTMFTEIFILDQLYKGNPPEEVRDLMRRQEKICMEWFETQKVDVSEFKKTLEQLWKL